MQLVILAAGRGSRLKKSTKYVPKCMTKVNGIPIISYSKPIFKYFKNIIIVSGYRSGTIKNFFEDKKIEVVKNNFYKKTNMVYSLFCINKKIKEDIIVVYGDIIFDHNIILKLIKYTGSVVPLNLNWLQLWKKRMNKKEIYEDAEDVTIYKNTLISIGGKIGKILPKYQFMGIMRIKKNDYFKMFKYFIKLQDKNIDFTSFIDLCIKKNIIKIKISKEKSSWFEIDKPKDQKVTSSIIKKLKLFNSYPSSI